MGTIQKVHLPPYFPYFTSYTYITVTLYATKDHIKQIIISNLFFCWVKLPSLSFKNSIIQNEVMRSRFFSIQPKKSKILEENQKKAFFWYFSMKEILIFNATLTFSWSRK